MATTSPPSDLDYRPSYLAAAVVTLDRFWGGVVTYVAAVVSCALTFVIIRAASFHHIDTVLYHIPGVNYLVNTVLELGGNVLVGYAAYRAATQRYESQYQIHEKKVSIR